MKLTLHTRKQEARDVYSFFFDTEKPFAWQAGQFLEYELPHEPADEWGTYRAFTIASAPSERRVQLTTRIRPESSSSFKRALLELRPGATIEADGPMGDFVLDHPDQPAVFIAGGIGITPFRAMLKDCSDRGIPVQVQLLYANQTPDVAFREEIEGWAKHIDGLTMRYFIEPERVYTASIQRQVPDWRIQRFFLSGPEPMVESLQAQLLALGIAENQIRLDAFPNYDWPEHSHLVAPSAAVAG